MKRYTIIVETNEKFDAVVAEFGRAQRTNGQKALKKVAEKSLMKLFGSRHVESIDFRYKTIKKASSE